jgi:hypothetical protein
MRVLFMDLPSPVARHVAFLSLCVALCATSRSDTIIHAEDFTLNPLTNGWEVRGETNLFQWDAAEQNIRVTWDSSKTNSYFRLPLETIINSEDDFSFSLQLVLLDISAAVRPEFPGTFQIAFGFQHRADADAASFIRGTGANSPNLVEFNYFPDSGFGATVWPAMIPTNGLLNYSGNGDFSIFELPLELPLNVSFQYSATNHTSTLRITTNGALVGEIVDAPLVDVERGFRLDAFAIASYSDAGQNQSFPGSVLAHGIIDQVQIVTPRPPVGTTSGRLIAGEWVQEFPTVAGWTYRLEASTDLIAWAELPGPVEGTGEPLTLRVPDQNSTPHRFFRVKAFR